MNRGVSVEADNQAGRIGGQGAWGKGPKQVIGIGFDHAIKLGHV